MSKTNKKPLQTGLKIAKPSATLLINERSIKLIAEGRKVFRLGFGQSPFPVPQVVVKSLQENAHHKDYLPVFGLPALRKSVASHAHSKIGLDVSADQVMIGPGSKELIFGVQLALDADLLLPSPSWVTYEPQANMLGKKVHWMDTLESENWVLSPSTLQTACQSVNSDCKLLILNYPNNPTGTTYTADDLQALVDVLRGNNIIVISDEIYAEVDHTGNHVSLSQFYPEGTIISAGLSKWCGAGGWRLGTFIFPKELAWLQDAMRVIASETFSAVAAPIQYAAVTAFSPSEEINVYLSNSKKILSKVGNYVHHSLASMNIHCPKPKGGFYLFPNFKYYKDLLTQKSIFTSSSLCKHLLEETGIALLPGSDFGRPETELTARLSYVDFDGSQLLQLMKKEETFSMEEHCSNIVQAMKSLKSWILKLSD